MSERDEQQREDERSSSNADQPYDFWLEPIEDHLRSIRLWLKILTVVFIIWVVLVLITWLMPALPWRIPFFREFQRIIM